MRVDRVFWVQVSLRKTPTTNSIVGLIYLRHKTPRLSKFFIYASQSVSHYHTPSREPMVRTHTTARAGYGYRGEQLLGRAAAGESREQLLAGEQLLGLSQF